MRVLGLSTSYPKDPRDSTAPFIRSISHTVAAAGFDVHLVLPEHPDLAWPDGDAPIALHRVRYLPRQWANAHVWGYAGALRADIQLRAMAVAVLPAAAAAMTAALARLTRRLRPDVLHAHWVLPNGPLAALVARWTQTPLVISLHGSDVFLAERHPIFARAARMAFRRASQVTACSHDLAARAQALGALPERTTVIPYGVDADTFRPASTDARLASRARMEIESDSPVLLAVGRLVAKKGFRHLLEAMPTVLTAHPNAILLIAGGGDLDGELRAQSEALGITRRVRFMGDVDRIRLRDVYAAADALVVPSVHDAARNVDGLPNVLLEGLSCGLPVVASRIAGIPDVVEDGVNGLLVPEQDSVALARALSRLLSEPELRSTLGAAARERVERGLRWPTIGARYADVLRRAAASRR